MKALVDLYSFAALERAASRGWDEVAHLEALEDGDIDLIGLTHPANWLTEAEVEDVDAWQQ